MKPVPWCLFVGEGPPLGRCHGPLTVAGAGESAL